MPNQTNNNEAQRHVLTKEELVREVGRICQLTLTDSQVVVDAMFSGMVHSLNLGDRIEIRGFGVFFSRPRNARKGRNPKTGLEVDVPAKRVGRFRASKELLERVNLMAKTSAPGAGY